jgi:chromate transporter
MALFLAFNRLSLQGFGGVLPVTQRELVERLRWLDKAQFVELLAVAQILPGPNVVNLALMFGDRHFGWRGAVAAMTGMLAAPTAIVVLAAIGFAQALDQPAVAGALRGMGAVAAGLVAATALKLSTALRRSRLGIPAAAAFVGAGFAMVGLLRLPLIAMLATLGPLACALAWWRLGRNES